MSLRSSLWDLVGRVTRNVGQQQKAFRHRVRTRHDPTPPLAGHAYPGDHHGPLTVVYAPHAGSLPDPGEVVWTWVPFEEDYSQGKDRPVLIVSREADWLLGLPLSSVNHDRDAAQEASEGRYWVEIGRGPWDTRGKESAVRVNRVVRVDPRQVRRIGGKLDKARFDVVATALREHHGT